MHVVKQAITMAVFKGSEKVLNIVKKHSYQTYKEYLSISNEKND